MTPRAIRSALFFGALSWLLLGIAILICSRLI